MKNWFSQQAAHGSRLHCIKSCEVKHFVIQSFLVNLVLLTNEKECRIAYNFRCHFSF